MKRGNIYFWYAAAVALMAIAGCTKTVHTPENGEHSIGFNVQESVKAAVTGAADITSFEVWGWYGTGAARDKNVFDGVEVSKQTTGAWVYSNIQYWVPGMNYTFYAVYPFGYGECAPNGTVTVNDLDCSATGEDAVDLMTAEPVEGSGDSPQNVLFTFSHELSKLKFSFESSQTEVTVTYIKLYGISAGGSLTKTPGNVATWILATAETAENTPYSVEQAALNADNGYIAEPYGELLLPPHAVLTDAKISFSYYYGENNANIKSADISLATGTGNVTSWEAGKSYGYTVAIPAEGKIKITVTVDPWEERNASVTWTPNN